MTVAMRVTVIGVTAYYDSCQFLIIMWATVSVMATQFSTLDQTAIFMDTWQLR
jgi:hypothetical protein